MLSSIPLLPIDYALIALGIYGLFIGWRRGLIDSVFAILGVGLGIWLANTGLEFYYGASEEISSKRIAITTLVFFVGIAIGNIFGSIIGNFIRSFFARGPLNFFNKLTGSAFSALIWAAVLWLLSGFISALPVSKISETVDDSYVITKLDEYVPDEFSKYIDFARSLIITSQLPEVAIDVIAETEPEPEIEVLDTTILKNTRVVNAFQSVARIESISEQCNTRLSGSGFVIAENLVVTNAHVVAGINRPNVRIGGKGKSVSGKVIYFDSRVDLALIRTNGLTAAALSMGENLERNDVAVVAGFPLGGNLTPLPARIKAVAKATDKDIYGNGEVTREMYVLNAGVQQGDSGAALLDAQGKVVGVVFAASAAESSVGYALTLTELKKALIMGQARTEAVKTGKCIPIPDSKKTIDEN
jgi:S1-C subfamily serine protease